MMARDRPESTWEPINYGRFITRFPPDTINWMRGLDRIITKVCKQRMSILFNQICIDEEMPPKYAHTHTHTHTNTHTNLYNGSVRGVINTVVVKEPSSNPVKAAYITYRANSLWKGMNPTIFPPAKNKADYDL